MTQETQPEHPDPQEPQDEGSEGEGAGTPPDEGPDPSELDQDPAYEPDDEGLKDLKGG